MIKNTKLGIPDGMLVVLIFLAGITDSFLMVALVVYVLLFEKGDKVKGAAKKALILFGLFAVLQGGLHVVDYVIRILLTNESGYNTVYVNFSYALSGARIGTYMVLGIKEMLAYMSLRGSGVSVQKDEPEEKEQPVQVTASQAATPQAVAPQSVPGAMVCPVCGNHVDKGVRFCKKCGAKTAQ